MPASRPLTSPEPSRRTHIVWSTIRLIGALVLLGLAVKQVLSAGHPLPPWRSLDAA